MNPTCNAHDVPKEGAPADANKSAVSSTADGSQEKPSVLPVGSSPRPARLASPASSCRGTPPPPRQAPPAAAGGRSVRSIVEWLEGPRQPDSPPANRVSGPKSTPAASVASIPADHHRPADQNVAHAEDVEEYSLTYLNYKGFYREAPLARCLDEVKEDLSKKPLGDVFKDAEKKKTASRTVVNVTSPVPSCSAAAEEKTSGVESPTAVASIAGYRVSAAEPRAGGDQGQESIRRDPQEVEAF